jgi:hypothetical protein
MQAEGKDYLRKCYRAVSCKALFGGICCPSLLIDATFVFDPSRCVMPIWVAMCPVNRSALFVPLIFAEKSYFVANVERDNPRCQVNIVGNQDCLARFEFNDKSLVSTPVVIVR